MRRALRLATNRNARSPPAYRLVVVFGFRCGRILGRIPCWLSLSSSFHFPVCSTVELLSWTPKLNLKIPPPEETSYRGALHSGSTLSSRDQRSHLGINALISGSMLSSQDQTVNRRR